MKQPYLSSKALVGLSCMLALLATISCTRTADVLEAPKEPKLDKAQELSIEDRTVQLFSSLYASSLRNGSAPTLSSLDSTETESPETKLYVANFKDGGFMLFRDGGNEQMEVIGHSDESSLHFSDGEENPILAQIFRTSASSPVDHLGVSPPKPSPIPEPNPNPNPGGIPPSIGDYPRDIIESESAPYIVKDFEPNTYKYFGQEAPFNDLIIKTLCYGNYPAGCGPIAIATLLSHYEMQAGGSNVPWKRLKDRYNYGTAEEVNLYHDIGLLSQLRVLVKDTWKYAHLWSTDSFTLSTPSNISGYLKRAGFNVAYVKNYKPSEICQILRDKHQPFILLGWSQDDSGKKGHYWVVDGLARRVHKEYGHTIAYLGATPEPFERVVSDKYYIHCTWGWYGDSNGWFTPRAINDNEGIPDNELRSTHPKGEYYNISTFHIWK